MVAQITKIAKNFFILVFGIYLKDYSFTRNSLETIALYAKNDAFVQSFTKIRFWDAPYLQVEKLVPEEGTIIDLGCGEGLFSNFLAISSAKRRIIGIDIDERRLEEARKGLANTKFILGDVTKKELPQADTFVLMHLLHHLNSYKHQENLILSYSRILKKNGILIIVEVEPKISFKYLITWCTDHFLVPILFEKRLYSPIFFRKSEKWKQLLESLGFSCTVIPAEKGKPFSHIIFLCKKRK